MALSRLIQTSVWRKRQLIFRFFLIGLCALIVFAPKLSDSALDQPTSLTLSTPSQSYAFLGMPQRSAGEFHRLRSSQAESFRRLVGPGSRATLPGPYHLLLSSPVVLVFQSPYYTYHNLQQICQLLDMPPPVLLFS